MGEGVLYSATSRQGEPGAVQPGAEELGAGELGAGELGAVQPGAGLRLMSRERARWG